MLAIVLPFSGMGRADSFVGSSNPNWALQPPEEGFITSPGSPAVNKEAPASKPPGAERAPTNVPLSPPDIVQGWDLWNLNQPAAPPAQVVSGEPCSSSWLDNLSVFGGLDGSKGPEDLGINANFGLRAAVNWGYPLLESYGLGIQLGTGLNYSRTAIRVLRSIDGTRDRTQSFSTVGLFQRTDRGWNWGVVYDVLAQDYYQHLSLGQVRGQVSYAIGANDEVGVWGTVRSFGDNSTVGGLPFHLKPIPQGNLFWRHIWREEVVTRIWVGLAEEHGRFVLLAPGNTPVHHPVVFGAEVYVPLSERWALFGDANFITPNDTGTVTATFGFVFYPGAKAHHTARSRFAPLLPLGNNTTFAVDLQQ